MFRDKIVHHQIFYRAPTQKRASLIIFTFRYRNETKPDKKPNKCPLVNKKISLTSTIHPGIFLEQAPSADSVSSRMNTIASRDQFKPISIGESLVVNNRSELSTRRMFSRNFKGSQAETTLN